MNATCQRLTILVVCVILPLLGRSQDIQQMIALPGLTAGTTAQPAHLAPLAEGVFRVGIDGGTQYHSTAFPYGFLSQPDGFLDEAEKLNWIAALSDRNDFRSTSGGQIQIQTKFRGHSLSLGYAQNIDLAAVVRGNELAELALMGNVAFQGQTVTGQGVALQLGRSQQLQLGYARSWGKEGQLRTGIHLGLIHGMNFQSFQLEELNLYTALDADSVSLQTAYQLFEGNNGWGAAATLGIDWKITPQWHVEAAAGNVGGIRWNGEGREVDAFLGTAGIDGGPLFRNILPLSDSLFRLDTLNELFLPAMVAASQTQQLLPRGHVGLRYTLPHWNFFGAFHWQYALQSRVIPTGAVSVQYLFTEAAHPDIELAALGIHLSSSPWQALGLGAMARGRIRLNDQRFLMLYVMADHLQGWVLPEEGRAVSLRGGIQYVIW